MAINVADNHNYILKMAPYLSPKGSLGFKEPIIAINSMAANTPLYELISNPSSLLYAK